MLPTPEHAAFQRIEGMLDAWGRAEAHRGAAPTPAIVDAVSIRRRLRRTAVGAGAAVAILALLTALWLLLRPAGGETIEDDPSGVASTRLIDLRRANPALDARALHLPDPQGRY